jgi:hypothetical protein
LDTLVLDERMVSRALVPVGDTRKQTYLAGPMRGYELFNFPAFEDAAKKLRGKGYKVFSPAEQDLKMGFDPATGKYADDRKFNIRKAMMTDLSWIAEYADLIVVLPDWRKSKGAMAEVHTAKAIGIPVYELGDVLDDNMRKVIV